MWGGRERERERVLRAFEKRKKPRRGEKEGLFIWQKRPIYRLRKAAETQERRERRKAEERKGDSDRCTNYGRDPRTRDPRTRIHELEIRQNRGGEIERSAEEETLIRLGSFVHKYML